MFLQGGGVAVYSSQWAPDSLVSGQVFASGASVRQSRRNSVGDGTAGCQWQVCPGILTYSDRSILQIRGGDLKCICDSCVNVKKEMKWWDESATKRLLKEGIFEELHNEILIRQEQPSVFRFPKLKSKKAEYIWERKTICLYSEQDGLISEKKEEMQNSKLFFCTSWHPKKKALGIFVTFCPTLHSPHYRESYDIHIKATVDQSNFTSGNILDLKNPFFRLHLIPP